MECRNTSIFFFLIIFPIFQLTLVLVGVVVVVCNTVLYSVKVSILFSIFFFFLN